MPERSPRLLETYDIDERDGVTILTLNGQYRYVLTDADASSLARRLEHIANPEPAPEEGDA